MRYLLKIVQIIICHFCNHTWATDQCRIIWPVTGRIRVCNRCHKRESSSFSRDIEGSWVLTWDNDPIKRDPWSAK